MVSFWVRHKLIEDACRFVFSQKLPQPLFLEEVRTHGGLLVLRRDATWHSFVRVPSYHMVDCWLLLVTWTLQGHARRHRQDRPVVRAVDAVLAGPLCLSLQETSLQAVDRAAGLYEGPCARRTDVHSTVLVGARHCAATELSRSCQGTCRCRCSQSFGAVSHPTMAHDVSEQLPRVIQRAAKSLRGRRVADFRRQPQDAIGAVADRSDALLLL